ncbi:hypothetical protein V1514DRAFT_327990 [Lipomyces japonicus]|uniref:uncharacterized protein n=1 Tax=Lipomyces japonicus TaxID=56871 RepID=UPI0034D00FE5
MGANSSKERSLLPDVPVTFSEELISKLEDVPESDFTRLQVESLKIEKSVGAELAKIQDDARNILEREWARTTESNDNKANNNSKSSSSSSSSSLPSSSSLSSSLTSPELLADIAKLKAQLVARQEQVANREQEGKKFGYEGPRQALLECLQKNDRRPLVCVTEFNAFREKLENAIA